MPIIVNNFKWRQTNSLITIQLPLNGVHQSKVDLFTSPKYIKASYEHYFFEAFLYDDINTSESSCTITHTEIIFELVKSQHLLWEKLESVIPKNEKMQLKKRFIEEEYQRHQNECKEKQNKKCELKRVAVREQIAIETRQRELVEKIRNSEKITALGDLEGWREQTAKPKIIELLSDEDEDPPDRKTHNKPVVLHQPLQQRRLVKHNKLQTSHVSIPLPRKTAVLQVDFTARQFPTPSRESQLEEENEWLRKQAEVRRSVGFVSEDLRPEEKNPQYLKSKGEEFLKAGNYLGAISAFSFGIKLTEKFPDFYVGRSQAHFELGNYYKAMWDCSTALELLRPAVSANLNERVTCIARRGMSLCKMGMLMEGISELEMAVKLRPDEYLKKTLNEAKHDLELASSNDK